MDYNTEQADLIMPEYGRNVQKMVEYLLTIEDEELLKKQASVVVDVMGNLNPHLRDVPDFKHKLWDHLFIMSDHKLNIESPYPIPTKEDLNKKPNSLSYPKGRLKYRHYGRNILKLINHIDNIESEEIREQFIVSVCNVMKNSYIQWNSKLVDDEVVIKQFHQLSDHKYKLPENVILSDIKIKRTNKNYTKNYKHRK